MIVALLAGMMAAAAEPDVDALTQRLLGPDQSTVAAVEAPAQPVPSTPWWVLPAAAGGIALLWWVRRKGFGRLAVKGAATETVRIVGRTSLDSTHGLVVVEVLDGEGAWRRLLVGTGAAPALVAELGPVNAGPPVSAVSTDPAVPTDPSVSTVPFEDTLAAEAARDRKAASQPLLAQVLTARRRADRSYRGTA